MPTDSENYSAKIGRLCGQFMETEQAVQALKASGVTAQTALPASLVAELKQRLQAFLGAAGIQL